MTLDWVLDPFSLENLEEPAPLARPGVLEKAYGSQFLDVLVDLAERDSSMFSPHEYAAIVNGTIRDDHALQMGILLKLDAPTVRKSPMARSYARKPRQMPPLGEEVTALVTAPLRSPAPGKLPFELRDLLLPRRDPDV